MELGERAARKNRPRRRVQKMTATPKNPAADATEALSVRDKFALAAIPGILASFKPLPKDAFEIAALSAYKIADAMLEARADDKQLTARVKKNRQSGSTPDG